MGGQWWIQKFWKESSLIWDTGGKIENDLVLHVSSLHESNHNQSKYKKLIWWSWDYRPIVPNYLNFEHLNIPVRLTAEDFDMPSTPSFFHFCLLDVRGKVGLVSSPSNFTSAHWKLCVDAFSEWVNLLPGNTNSKECGRRRQSKLHHRARWIFCSLSSSICFEDCIPCIQTVVRRATRNQWVLNATFIKFLSETTIKIYWLFISLKQYMLNHVAENNCIQINQH
jgi:hypothetical protein